MYNQFKKRFSFNSDSLIAKLNVLDPNESFTQNRSPSSIIPLAAHFPMLVSKDNLNDLDDQWRSYRTNVDNLPAAGDCIPQYWYRLRNIKDVLQNLKYGILSDFMTNLIVLLHFSAAVERIFSSINCIKTRQTNSLKAETVKNRIIAKQAITRGNNICTTWTPSKKIGV